MACALLRVCVAGDRQPRSRSFGLAVSKLFGLEPAVKLIVLAIPPMTVAGFLWVAREVHGRLPPTALFALPFAYSHPFMFGFVNYALSIALAFLAFGLWLRLARLGRLKLRAILFVPISFIVFFAHTFGWGMLGLMAFSAEAVRQHDRGSVGSNRASSAPTRCHGGAGGCHRQLGRQGRGPEQRLVRATKLEASARCFVTEAGARLSRVLRAGGVYAIASRR